VKLIAPSATLPEVLSLAATAVRGKKSSAPAHVRMRRASGRAVSISILFKRDTSS
jgi:hypothetical protein